MNLTPRIQVLIKTSTPYGEFHDALSYSVAEFAAMSTSEVEDAADLRVSAWVETVKNPPAPVEPTDEELTMQAKRLQKDLDRIYEVLPDLKQARYLELDWQLHATPAERLVAGEPEAGKK